MCTVGLFLDLVKAIAALRITAQPALSSIDDPQTLLFLRDL